MASGMRIPVVESRVVLQLTCVSYQPYGPDQSLPMLIPPLAVTFSCQLITHAHFDHILAMVLATGSLPPRSLPPYPPGSLPSDKPVRIQVYAQRNVLEKISTVYDGEVWPELGAWAGRPIPPGDTILGVGSGLSGIKSRLEGMVDSLIHPKDDGNRTDDGLGERFNKEHNGGSEELGRQKPARQSYASMEGIGIQYCP